VTEEIHKQILCEGLWILSNLATETELSEAVAALNFDYTLFEMTWRHVEKPLQEGATALQESEINILEMLLWVFCNLMADSEELRARFCELGLPKLLSEITNMIGQAQYTSIIWSNLAWVYQLLALGAKAYTNFDMEPFNSFLHRHFYTCLRQCQIEFTETEKLKSISYLQKDLLKLIYNSLGQTNAD